MTLPTCVICASMFLLAEGRGESTARALRPARGGGTGRSPQVYYPVVRVWLYVGHKMKPTTLAAGLGASLPVIASTIHAVGVGVVPAGDRAIIALRADEVLSAHPPLVGQYSASSVVAGAVTHSPGPMLYWLLALPAHYGSPSSPAVMIGLLNTLCILFSVALARRRGGAPFMFVAAIALVLLSRSWSPETLHDIWNPAAGLFPFTLVLFLSWSLACGEYRLLALTAIAGSFAVQSELTFLLPTVAAVAVGLLGLVAGRVAARRRHGPQGGEGDAQPQGRMWPWLLAGLLALAVCWSAPVVDEIEHSPGNLTLLMRAARASEPKQGLTVGWHAVVRAVGIPPWWLTSPSGPFVRQAQVHAVPTTLATVSTLVLLALLTVVLLVGALRGGGELAYGAAVGVVLCLALGAVAGETPIRPSVADSLGYTMWWGSQAGMWVWLMLMLAGIRLLRSLGVAGAPARAGRPRSPRSASLAALAGAVAVIAAGGAVALAEGPDQDEGNYAPIGVVNARLGAVLRGPAHTVVMVGFSGQRGFDFRAAAAFALHRDGLRVLDPAAAVRLSPAYELDAAAYQAVVRFEPQGARSRGRVIAVVPPRQPGGGAIIVTLERVSAGRRAAPAGRSRGR